MKPGYKQTEVGVIPEEWEVKRLGEIANVGTGGTPDRANASYWNGDVPWVTTSEVSFGVISQTEQHITKEGLRNSASKLLQPGTLLMALYGQGKTRGKVGVLGIEAATNQACASISLNKNVLISFVFQYLVNQYEAIRGLSNVGNQENLNNEIVRALVILLPPFSEQRAIAEALSDVDALLTAQDKLIAKKRDLKQAAMQQLLTGQTRLPGFSGAWEVKLIRNFLKVRHGKSQSNISTPAGAYPILATGGEVGRTNLFIYDKPSVLIGRKGTIDSPQYSQSPFWAIDTIFFTEVFDEAHPKYVFYLFGMIPWQRYNESTGLPSLNARTIESIEVTLPKLAEQTAIAAILSDMDAELAALEQRRAKTRALKQAMMQELLTGQTRLV
jgi:type I restriction enzyme S subunit